MALRLKRSSDSIVFKCDLYHPFEHYSIGIQRCINNNFTLGLLAEKIEDNHQQKPIKFSLMSQWHLDKIGIRFNTLVNTHNELGVLQTFGLYSWTAHKCKWGVGLQILI